MIVSECSEKFTFALKEICYCGASLATVAVIFARFTLHRTRAGGEGRRFALLCVQQWAKTGGEGTCEKYYARCGIKRRGGGIRQWVN